jgi:hypothetical protein
MPDDRIKEFDEDFSFPILDLSAASPQSPEDARFTYSFEDIDQLSKILSIPWELAKDILFTSHAPFIGFLWDIKACSISIPQKKRKNTWQPLESGRLSPGIPYRRFRSFMGSSYMPLWSSQQDELTLFLSKPCYPYFMTIHTCLILPPSTQVRISIGGKPASHSPSSLGLSQDPSESLTPQLTQTLAQALALRFGSMADGEHGVSSQAGKPIIRTSAGQKQLGWNSLLSHSSVYAQKAAASKYSATIRELLKDGGKGKAITKLPT